MSVQTHQKLGMDAAQQAAFVRFFKSMPEKPASTVRIFDRNEYYSLQGEDAILAAKEIFKSTSSVKQMTAGTTKLDYVVLNQNHFETLLRTLLLIKSYRVEVYTAASNAKTATSWNLEFKASPGNLSQFEDVLFGDMSLAKSQPHSGVAALKISTDAKNKLVGFGYVDGTNRQMTLAQFTDSDNYCGLECILLQLAPRELLLPSGVDESDLKTIQAIGERCGLLVTTGLKKSWFTAEEAFQQDLGRLLKKQPGQTDNIAALEQLKLTVATPALNACISFLELVSESSNFGQFTLSEFCSDQYVRVDGQTARAVNLRPPAGSSGLGRPHESLLGLLGQAVRTPQGQRLVARWLQQPLRDVARLTERQDCVEALANNLAAMDSLSKDYLRGVPDLPTLARKLHRKKVNLQDLYRIYQGVRRLSGVVSAIEGLSGSEQVMASVKALLLDPLREKADDMSKFVDMVEQTLDLNLAAQGEFVIKPEFDDTLKEIQERRDELKEEMESALYDASRQLHLEANKGVKLDYTAQWGHFYRITLKEEKILRGNKSFQIIDTNKGGVRFVNDKLKSLNDDYQAASDEYQQTQKDIVQGVIDVAAGYSETLCGLGEVLAHVDVLNSFAVAASSSTESCCRPKLLPPGSGVMKFKQLRHPCLERQPGVDFVPNDAEFDKDTGRLVILTGPNMGGKSTYIRSVGAAVLMAQVGAQIPAQEAELSLVDSVLARIGASDSQLRGVSTFMAEMLETSAILRAATANSLVVVDELGRGTSTYDGFGLAWAISEHIAKEVRCFCLFATHFHELTALSTQVPGVVNKHVLAKTSDGVLTLLYRVRDGPCDESFGVHVAKMANFPDEVIERAEIEQKQLELQHKWVPSEFLTDEDAERKEGEKLIEEFLESVAKFGIDDLPAASKHLAKLREDLKSKGNSFVQQVLQSFGV